MPDEIDQVAVLSGGRVGPLARDPGTVQADEERAPASALEIAGDPVPALLAALGQVAPADGLGALSERGGDVGGGRWGMRHDGPPLDGRGTPDIGRPLLSPAPEGEAPRAALARGPNRRCLGTDSMKKGRRAKRRPR